MNIKPFSKQPPKVENQIPRSCDFLPLLKLQTRLAKNTEVYYIKGYISERIDNIKGDPIETGDLGGVIRQDSSVGEKTVVEYGSRDPVNRDDAKFDTVSHQEILDDIQSHVEVEDVITRRRGIVHTVPTALEEDPVLDGAGQLFHEQRTYANMSPVRVRRVFGINPGQVKSPYHIIKEALINTGNMDSVREMKKLGKKLRSTLISEFIVPDNDRGYLDLMTTGSLLDVEKHIRAGHFWQDVAVPKRFQVSPNGHDIQGRLFALDRYKSLVGVG